MYSVPVEGLDKLEQIQEIKLAACSHSYGSLTRVWGQFRTFVREISSVRIP